MYRRYWGNMRKKFDLMAKESGVNLNKLYQEGSIPQILVGVATCGCAMGALDVIDAIRKKLQGININASIKEVGCIGLCFAEVLVDIIKPGMPRICYKEMTPEKAEVLVEDYLVNNDPRADWALGFFGEEGPAGIPKINELPIFKNQLRVVLKNCGHINPGSIDDYIFHGGYKGLLSCLETSPDKIIDVITKSRLRGLGGAGFYVGIKWACAHKFNNGLKYVICNANEGDPGAFIDRSVLEGDPHSVLEGMTISGYAIGASKGFLYVQSEYSLAIINFRNAIAQAKKKNLLGKNILGSNFSFDIEIYEGSGSFICGESTALIMSMEGNSCIPKIPPRQRTAEVGLQGNPTLVNNVKTFTVIPQIISKGPDWFLSIGTYNSHGTAVFTLNGKINNRGIIEVPMGIKLETIVEKIGGGVIASKKFKALQIGGPSGGCLPESRLKLHVDFDNLIKAGSMLGSGRIEIMDEAACMVNEARRFIDYISNESCGQCTSCRLGTHQMLQILNDICEGRGRKGDIELLIEIGEAISQSAVCGFGHTASNPVLSTIKYFREEYELHIKEKSCPAHVCKSLISYRINAERCVGCERCFQSCPAEAIRGTKDEAHVIISELCTKCGICHEVCPRIYSAVECLTGKESITIPDCRECN